MKFTRKEIIKWVEYFMTICKNNNIWYSIDAETMLGAYKHGGFVPWFEKFQVMLTPEAYTRLQRVVPQNVIDGAIDKNYKSLKPSFVQDRLRWQNEVPFIEIRIITPSTIKNIKSFRNPFKSFLNKLLMRRNNTKIAINDLFSNDFEGFYIIDSKNALPTNNWIPNLSFKMKTLKFNGLELPVVEEFLVILKKWFGNNFMSVNIVPIYTYSFPFPTHKVKELI